MILHAMHLTPLPPVPKPKGGLLSAALYSFTKLLNDLTVNPYNKFPYLNRKKTAYGVYTDPAACIGYV